MLRTRHLPTRLMSLGLLAGLLSAPPLAAQTTYVITQPGFSFSPSSLVIDVGDTVRWQWSFDSHTVTEGPGPIPVGGEAFDEFFDAGNPVIRVTFDRTFLKAFPRTNNVYQYYCIPHWAFGMTGTITVRETIGTFADESQVNPPTGAAGTGSGNLKFNLATNSLAWNIGWSGLTGPATAAHFHKGAVGVNGAPEVTVGTANPNSGSAVLSPAQRADLLAGNWYLNIHTAANPGGEIRGQLLSGDWDDLGGGTSGINGVPRLRGIGTLTGLSTVSLDLSDGPANGLCLLWVSISSSPLSVLGGTVHAVPFLDQVLLATDANGRFAAGTPLPPFIPAGSTLYFQFILQDLSTFYTLTLSTAVRGTTP